MPAIVIAAASLAVATVGTAYSITSSQAAAKQQKQANVAVQARSDLQAARERRDAIRSARMAAGNARQAGETQGVSQSSSALGGLSSITSQLGSNLSFLDQYKVLSDQASEHLGKAEAFKTAASTGADVASLGFTVMNNAQTVHDTVSKVFKQR